MKHVAYVLLPVSLAVLLSCGAPVPSLTEEHRAAVSRELLARKLGEPNSLTTRDAFIVADYETTSLAVRLAGGAEAFGEARLLAIREALLPFGYKDYRVNVNGPPPGTGLIQRYGSARFIDAGGTVEWLPPPRP